VYDREPEQVLAAVRFARFNPAIIGPRKSNWVALFTKNADTCDPEILNETGETLSRTLATAILSLMIYHNEVLFFTVFEQGRIIIEYDSFPEYSGRLSKNYFNLSNGKPTKLIRFCKEGTSLKELKDILQRRPQKEILKEIEEEEGMDGIDLHFKMPREQLRNRLREKIVYFQPRTRLADLSQVLGIYDSASNYRDVLTKIKAKQTKDKYLHIK